MKTNVRKIIMGSTCLALVAAVSAGGTFAYLTAQTEKRANNFTFSSEALTARLSEPKWDGVIDYVYDDNDIYTVYDYIDHDNDPTTDEVPVYGYEDGDVQKPVTDKELIDDNTDRPRKDSNDPTVVYTYGDEDAQDMIPGAEAAKNPLITNTCDINEYVAAKITFVYAEGSAKAGQPLNLVDYQAVIDIIEIDYNETEWERVTGTTADVSQVFSFKNIVTPGDSTTPLFTTVSVTKEATNEQIKALEDMGGFAIWIEGYAAQADALADYATFKTGIVFNNTPTETAPANVVKPGIIGAN